MFDPMQEYAETLSHPSLLPRKAGFRHNRLILHDSGLGLGPIAETR